MRAALTITLAVLLAAAASGMTYEQFRGLEFATVIKMEETPSGQEMAVVGAAGQVDGENRVAAGLFIEGEELPRLLAYFYLDGDSEPVACREAGEEWECWPVEGRNKPMIQRDLRALRKSEFGHPTRPKGRT